MIGFVKKGSTLSDQRPDIIIIGGGSAGLEIARIASRAGQKITLLEDGLPKGRHVMQRVPLLVGKIIANLRFVSHDKTLPQKGLAWVVQAGSMAMLPTQGQWRGMRRAFLFGAQPILRPFY